MTRIHRTRRCRLFILACGLLGMAPSVLSAQASGPEKGEGGELTVPSFFSEHMVLRKAAKVPVWGKATPGLTVTVTLGKKTAKAPAGPDGKWRVDLNLADVGPEPQVLVIQAGKTQLTISDVLVGEVWLASGQSNMGFGMGSVKNAKAEIAASSNQQIRFFMVAQATSPEPLWDVPAGRTKGVNVIEAGGGNNRWAVAGPDTTGSFSAVAYYFARNVQKDLAVPVGVICPAWGGTPVQAWTSSEALQSVPDLAKVCNAQWFRATNFDREMQAFRRNLEEGLQKEGRQDRPCPDPMAYAGADVAKADWIPVKFPGLVKGNGLPKTGALWLRKEFEVTGNPSSMPPMKLAVDNFYTIYLNGVVLKEVTPAGFAGSGAFLNFYQKDIDAAKAKYLPGKNVLAIRVYQPLSADNVHGILKVGDVNLGGEWLAKAEYGFPDPSAETILALPLKLKSKDPEQGTGARLWNAMVHPFVPYAITGVIWYQGEANKNFAWEYRTAFPLLIRDWRSRWGQGDFPFLYCQLHNHYDKVAVPGDNECAELREAQALALSLPNTGMAVTLDLGESDIHPIDKKPVGDRLAALALAKTYGKAVPCEGPMMVSHEKVGNQIRVRFSHADGGLVAAPLPETFFISAAKKQTAPLVRNRPGSALEGFAICGADRKWVWADGEIHGDTVHVSSPEVPDPVAVRYAWAIHPTCNLYNGRGFPAAPFRTDDFPVKTAGKSFYEP